MRRQNQLVGVFVICLAANVGDVRAQTSFVFGPSPYASVADRPVGFELAPVIVEDFEDGIVDPRLNLTLGGSIIGPGGLTDSVDADDGVVDGSGSNGHSLFRNATSIEITFPTLPTSVGLVWTDGSQNVDVTMQTFGPSGAQIHTRTVSGLGDGSNAGATAEDRFLGIRNDGGISRVLLSHTAGGMELDHIMFNASVEALIMGTFDDGQRAIMIDSPDADLPTPVQRQFSLPSSARPHAVAFLGTRALYQDFFNPRIFNIDPAAPGQVPIVALTGRTSGNGSLAVDPSQRYALSIGESSDASPVGEAIVIDFGVSPPVVNPIAGNLRVLGFVTAAIDFAPDGRAFVCHTDGVSVLRPPYRTIEFTMPFPSIVQSPSMCRLTRDGSRLFVSRVLSETAASINGIRTTTAPYSASSVFAVMPAPADVQGLGPMAVSADGQALLVGQQFLFPPDFIGTRARAFILRAPFDSFTAYQALSLPAAISGNNCTDAGEPIQCPGFEHIEVSRDGSLAVFTGNSGDTVSGAADRAPALFMRHPFIDSARSSVPVTIGLPGFEGRGSGGVAFRPDGLFSNSFE